MSLLMMLLIGDGSVATLPEIRGAIGAVSLDEITSVDWQVRLDGPGQIVEGADDVDQCIRSILMTPKGSVPHAPDFGSDLYRYADWPIASARPQIIRESIDAITLNEPRASLKRLSVSAANSSNPTLIGATILEVEWSLVGSAETQTTTVAIGRAE